MDSIINKRKSMATKSAILSYWKNWLDENEQPKMYNTEEKYFCFGCGQSAHLHRSHIIPIPQDDEEFKLVEDWINKPENIHLLCPICHTESEYLTGKVYFAWLLNKESSIQTKWKLLENLFKMFPEMQNESKGGNIENEIFDNYNPMKQIEKV